MDNWLCVKADSERGLILQDTYYDNVNAYLKLEVCHVGFGYFW